MQPKLYLQVFPLVLAAGLAASDARGANNACEATSRDAQRACRLEAESDYKLALGKCENITDPVQRKACQDQALTNRQDALAECKDQFDARQKVCDRLGGTPYDPVIASSNFVSTIDNPFYPLTPGTTYYYLGQTIDGVESNVVSVTANTKVILGVTCVEVHDVVYIADELEEDTLDWFAQDKDGNVWYFGEHSEQISGGTIVGLEGSFVSGEDSAKPGIIMKAHPAIGDFYRQEFLLKDAEDVAEVISTNETVNVPANTYNNCLKTEETSPLEPDALEHKFYASGVGNVLTVDEVTGERAELVRITP